MPQDPRHGQHGHHSPHQDGGPDEDNAPEQQSGRRRRALGDDGTGGTRVFDLLSKHGKAPGAGTGSHRRAAEPEPPDGSGGRRSRAAQPQQPQSPAAQQPPAAQQAPQSPQAPSRGRPTRGGPPPERRSDWTPPESASRPPTGRTRPAAPSRPAGDGRHSEPRGQQPAAPPNRQAPQRPQPPAQQPPAQQPPAQQPPAAQEPPVQQPPAAQQPPTQQPPAQDAQAAEWSAPGRAPQGPAARRGRGQQPPAPQEPRTGGHRSAEPPADAQPPARPGHPQTGRQPAPGRPQRPQDAPRRRRPDPQQAAAGSLGAASDAAATHIAKALSGEPTAEPEAPRRRREAPPADAQPPARPGRPGRPGRPAPSPAAEDPEATAVVPAVPAEPEKPPAEATKVTRVPETGPAREAADETAIVAPVTADDAEDADEDDADSAENDSDEIRQIDATLARFSAVHDEIAIEEDARRKKYSWLFGMRKEPELGRDMPFDFVEGRDAGSSRMDWKKEQRKRRTIRILKALAVAAALTIFVATGIGWSAKAWVDAKFKDIAALDPNSSSIKDISKQSGDRNFLLLGSDTRAGATEADGVGDTTDEPGARADTTMIAHIPADRSRVLVVSFPRDLQVDIPSCERWNPDTGQYTGEEVAPRPATKLNEAYAVGGPKCTTKVVQQLSGLSITNFLGIDFQGFKSMVDAMHGVDICSSIPIVDRKLGVVLPEAGPQTLSGTQALNYVRARYVEGDPTSDYGRMQRQQLFLSSLLRKAMSGQVLMDPQKLGGFVDAVAANTFGENVGTDQLLELGRSMQGMDAGKITFITVPTTGYANDEGMEELDGSEAAALFRAIIEDAPVSPRQAGVPGAAGGSGPASTGPASMSSASFGRAATAKPSDVPVRVVNASGRDGLAGRTADELSAAGYPVAGSETLSATSERTVVRHGAANAAAARLLASSVPGATTVQDDAAGGELRLELGTSYAGPVRAPGGQQAEMPSDLSTVNAGSDVCG
ncbi:LCP family glycopolymer transferase [Saccharopolyspora gregorii]|uniref:LCP family glycopolymer transferase n=1 Tax=Saccharopolyspora gregorii TaxID=33914 RepID=UPI0021AD28E0|nr:LCP family protein [Saccharopolyspora gregorii]